MLLLLTVTLVEYCPLGVPEVVSPRAIMPYVGFPEPEEPILLLLMVLLELPMLPIKVITPQKSVVLELNKVQLVMRLLEAPLVNCMMCPWAVLLLVKVRLFVPLLMPLMVTLSAPFNKIMGPLAEPEIVKLPPEGLMLMEV